MLRKNKQAMDSLVESMGLSPHKGQQDVLDAFTNNYRFICLVCGRRWGKSLIASVIAQYTLMEEDTQVLVVAKTYKLAKKVWKYLAPAAKKFFGNHNIKINNSDKTITTAWGSVLELGSADNPDSLLGDSYDVIITDEAATLDEDIWNQNLRPAVSDRKGTIILITTPRGHNWIYRRFLDGQKNRDGWWSYKGHAFDNYFIYDEAEKKSIRSQTDRVFFAQEYGADFVSFASQVYSDFSTERHVIDIDSDKKPNFDEWDIYVSIDPGFAQMCALQWIAYSKVHGQIYVIDEVLKPRMRYQDILRELKQREPKNGYAGFVCDVAGNQREQTGMSFINWFEETPWFLNHNYSIYSARYGIISGINKVRARLLNVNNETSLFVMSNCVGTIEMFENFHYPENKPTEKPEKDGIWDHPADTIRYFVEYVDTFESGSKQYDL